MSTKEYKEYEIDVKDTFAMLVTLPVCCNTIEEAQAVSEATADAFIPVLTDHPDLAVEIAEGFFSTLNENEIAHRVSERYIKAAIEHGLYERR